MTKTHRSVSLQSLPSKGLDFSPDADVPQRRVDHIEVCNFVAFLIPVDDALKDLYFEVAYVGLVNILRFPVDDESLVLDFRKRDRGGRWRN